MGVQSACLAKSPSNQVPSARLRQIDPDLIKTISENQPYQPYLRSIWLGG